jgi:glucuronoarabinoxylan endo-1,4-beta-xylanase
MRRALGSLSSIALFAVFGACSETGPNSSGTGGNAGQPAGGTNAVTGGAATGGNAGTGVAGTAGNPLGGSSATGGTTGGTPPGGGGTDAGGGAGTTGGAGAGGAATGGGAGMSGGAGAGSGAGGSDGGAGGETSTAVTVQLAQNRQEMAGFGINNNWQPAMTDAEADAMFDPVRGLGLSILRVGMNPNGAPYNSGLWDDIEKATARGCRYVIGTLWSPPARMKTNNSITGGGHLRPEFYNEWANTIAAFPAQVKQNTGVDLYAMSPQNETDFASCGTAEPCNGNYDTTIFTGAEYAAFIKVVGPKLRALNPPVKVIAPEASEWLHAWSNASGCCSVPGGLLSSDPLDCGRDGSACSGFNGYDYGHAMYADAQAWAAFDIFGTHQYDTQVAEPWPANVPDRKPVWQTEMSGVKWWPEQGPSNNIQNGVAVAGWIHNALTVGEASAWLWWWWKALGATNEGLLNSDGSDTKRRYTFGNYSRFIRPGYTRVNVTGAVPENILLTGFKGPDGTVVVVAINKGTAQATVPITIAGGTAPASMTPHVTSAADNLVAKTAVTVTGGIFMASLAGTTVTTFVGK